MSGLDWLVPSAHSRTPSESIKFPPDEPNANSVPPFLSRVDDFEPLILVYSDVLESVCHAGNGRIRMSWKASCCKAVATLGCP